MKVWVVVRDVDYGPCGYEIMRVCSNPATAAALKEFYDDPPHYFSAVEEWEVIG